MTTKYNKMNEELLSLVQTQIVNELNNARLYLSASNWFDFTGYFNLAKLYRKYYEEELTHHDKIIEYLLDRNIKPYTMTAEEPQCEFKSVREIVELTVTREESTTDHWNAIWSKALLVKDILTVKKADWFVAEQIEELSKAYNFLDKLNLTGDDKIGLTLFDQWVGEQL